MVEQVVIKLWKSGKVILITRRVINMKLIVDVYQKYWSFLPLYKSNFCVILISKILGTITSVLIPYFASGIVKYLTIGIIKKLYGGYFISSCFYVKVIFYYFNYYGAARDSQYCYTKLKEKCFHKLASYDLEFSKKKDIDEILQTTSSDIWGITALNDNLSDVIITFLKIIIVVFLISYTSIVVVELFLLYVFIYFVYDVF